ncbi:MAG: IPT/TIG domain-containing protein, partial [Acidobacteriota bacterium]|nr:IPT/TIG domain-containing protein [Acidobacteriota bacterium]
MRRNALTLLGIALVAFQFACSADAPAPTPPGQGGGGLKPTPGSSPLQVRLFTSNPNPTAGGCTLIQAIVSLNGVNVPDGTGVAFSTDFGTFSQNGLAIVSVTTQGGAAVTALCSVDPGLANVKASATVSGQTGSGSIQISFQPSALVGPFFSSCSPSFASNTGGDTLTLNGGRFFGSVSTTRVTFTAAGVTREALVTGVTGTAVTVRTPAFPEALSPSVPVTINLTFGTNTASPVTLTVPNCFAFGTASGATPSITAILPASGSNLGNTRVTIVGSGFASPLQVFFGPVEAQVLSVSYNQLVVLTPPAFGAGAPNLNATVEVRVHEVTSGVDATLPGAFRFVTPIQITSVGANQQRVDFAFQPVTIFGQGFDAPVAVSLAGISASVVSVSATEIIVMPGNPALVSCADVSGPVVVTNITTGDTATGSSFTYLVKQTTPIIGSVSPSSGPPGTTITITGANFTRVTSVRIGARSASFTVFSDSAISATVPDPGTAAPTCPAGTAAGTPVANGVVDIVLTSAGTGCTTTSTGAFVYMSPCVVAPVAPADLAITKTSNPNTVSLAGSTAVAYGLAVTNTGASPAAGTVVTDNLPPGVNFVSCTTTQGSCLASGSTVTANLGTVPAAGSANVTINVTMVGPARVVSNTANVTTTSPEPATANNTSTATTTV